MHIVRKETKNIAGHWVLLATLSLSLVACGGTNGRRDRRIFDPRWTQGALGQQNQNFFPERRGAPQYFPNGAPGSGPNPGFWGPSGNGDRRVDRTPGGSGRQGAGDLALGTGSAADDHPDLMPGLAIDPSEVPSYDLWEKLCYGKGFEERKSEIAAKKVADRSADEKKIWERLDRTDADEDGIPDACEAYLREEYKLRLVGKPTGRAGEKIGFPNGYLTSVRILEEEKLRRLTLSQFGKWTDPKDDYRDAFCDTAELLKLQGAKRVKTFCDRKGFVGFFKDVGDSLVDAAVSVKEKFQARKKLLNHYLAALVVIDSALQDGQGNVSGQVVCEADGNTNCLIKKIYDMSQTKVGGRGIDMNRITTDFANNVGPMLEKGFLDKVENKGVAIVRGGNRNPIVMKTTEQRTQFRVASLPGVRRTLGTLAESDAFISITEGWIEVTDGTVDYEAAIARLKHARSAGAFILTINGDIHVHNFNLDDGASGLDEAIDRIRADERLHFESGIHHFLLTMVAKEVTEEVEEDKYIAENLFIQSSNAGAESSWFHMPKFMSTYVPWEDQRHPEVYRSVLLGDLRTGTGPSGSASAAVSSPSKKPAASKRPTTGMPDNDTVDDFINKVDLKLATIDTLPTPADKKDVEKLEEFVSELKMAQTILEGDPNNKNIAEIEKTLAEIESFLFELESAQASK